MTRTKRFLHGVGWGYVNQFVMAAAGLYLTRFYLHSLGSSIYGLWMVGMQILAYLALLDLGIIALLPRETAYALGGDRSQLPNLIGETLSIAAAQTPILGLLTILVWFLLPVEWLALRGPLAFTFTAFVLTFPLRAYPAVLQGLQDFSFLGKAHVVTWVLGTVASVACLKLGLNLYALAAGWMVTQGTLFAACFWRMSRAFSDDLPRSLPWPTWQKAKKRLERSLWITLSQISQVLLVGTDILVVGKILGPAAVVMYSVTGKLVQLLANQPQTVTQAALPGLAELKSTRDLGAIRRVSEALTILVMLLSGVIVAVVLAINGGFVRWWVGVSHYGGDLLTGLLLANMVIRHYSTTLVFSLFCFGHEKTLAIIGIADGLVTLGLSLLLTPHLGIKGPVVASLVSGVLVSVPSVAVYLARELELSLFDLVHPLASWLWRFGIVGAMAAAVVLGRPPRGPMGFSMLCVVLGSLYGLLMLPVLKRSALQYYVQPAWDRAVAFRRAK